MISFRKFAKEKAYQLFGSLISKPSFQTLILVNAFYKESES